MTQYHLTQLQIRILVTGVTVRLLILCNLLILQSSQRLRAKKGTEGNSRRASLMTHSRYFRFFRSSVLMGRPDAPLHSNQETGNISKGFFFKYTFTLNNLVRIISLKLFHTDTVIIFASFNTHITNSIALFRSAEKKTSCCVFV